MPDTSNDTARWVVPPVELTSAHEFHATLSRLSNALEGVDMKIFARIDHDAEAEKVGLKMPPTTVLIYGNPRGGTPLMLTTPAVALDLPLRILVREGVDGKTMVSYHPAAAMKAGGLTDKQLAGFFKLEVMIACTIKAIK